MSKNEPPRVALTFDDGPNPATTPHILAALAAYHAQASFMLWGEHAVAAPDLVRQEVAVGHALGDHTYTHPNLTELSADAANVELNRTDAAIKAISGQVPVMIRPPFGAYTEDLVAQWTRPAVIWRVDSEDWKSHDPESIFTRVTTQIQDGDIVLMHDALAATAQVLPRVLQYLHDHWFQLVTVPDLIGPRFTHAQVIHSRTDVTMRNREDKEQ